MADSRACPACRETCPRPLYSRDGVGFVRGGRCRTIYQAAAPDWARIERIYQDDYHAARGHAGDPAVEATKRATALAYLRLMARYEPPGRGLIEVGCSAGAALAAAASAGWDARGVEVSVPSAELARQRPGVRAVYTGRLEDAPLPDGDVDAFMLLDVIEHMDPPDAALATMFRKLRPGGLALFVTPDGDSISARLMGPRWPHLFIEHVVLYSRGGMRRALARAGFEFVRCGFAWKRVNLDVLVRHATLHPHVTGGALLRLVGKLAPRPLLQAMLPFNIGEFYMLARRPR